jgi:hypothetical protein
VTAHGRSRAVLPHYVMAVSQGLSVQGRGDRTTEGRPGSRAQAGHVGFNPASHPPDKSLRDYRAEHRSIRPTGRRSWWAHFELTRINITPTILHKKIEGLRQLGAFMFLGHVGPLTR